MCRPAMIRISSPDRGQTGRAPSAEFLDEAIASGGVLHPSFGLVARLDEQLCIIYQIGYLELGNARLACPGQFTGAAQSKIGFGKSKAVAA